MKYLNKTLFATTLLASLFASQTVMADEFPEEAGDHPHATSTDKLSKPDGTMQMKRENYMLHQNIEEESSLDEELFPDPEH